MKILEFNKNFQLTLMQAQSNRFGKIIENRIVILISIFIITLFVPAFPIKMLAIAMLFISMFFENDLKYRIKEFIKNPLSWLLFSYYLMHLIGLFYTNNMHEAFHYLEIRATFLAFPLMFFVLKIKPKQLKIILLIFAFSTILFSLIGLGYRAYFYFNEVHDTGYFYSDNIIDIFGMQAVYYAVYVNFSIFILTHYLFGKSKVVFIPNWVVVISIIYLFLINFLLASRLSMLSLYFMSLVYLIVYIVKQRKLLMGAAILVSGVSLLISLMVFFPKTLKRFQSIENVKFNFENTNPINHYNGEISDENWNGANTRLAIWTCAYDVIMDNLLIGVGTGDYSDKLNEKYNENKFYFGIQRQFGTHNMYLQTIVMFGIAGLIVFLIFLFYPLIMAIRQQEYLYVVFVAFIMFAMLTEDFFSRNQGILLFTFFNSIYVMQVLNRDKIKG